MSCVANCWTGNEFIRIKIERLDRCYKPKLFVPIDAVTTVAIDEQHCPAQGMSVAYQWMPPWLSGEGDGRRILDCSPDRHVILALHDFLLTTHSRHLHDHTVCRVPTKRFDRLEDMLKCLELEYLVEQRWRSDSKRYVFVQLPKIDDSCLCESALTKFNRIHALTYIRTVLAVKAVRSKRRGHSILEVRDDGVKLKPQSFRRLRRCLAMCAVPNRYAPKTYMVRNGRARKWKKMMRLSLAQDDGNASCLHVKENFGSNTQYIEYLKTISLTTKMHIVSPATHCLTGQNIPWYRITLSKGASVAVEGVVLTVNN